MTKTKTIQQRLLGPIKKQLRCRTKSELAESLRDISGHGADTGWPGFTYTSDCVAFYEENKEAIWSLLHEMANDMGLPNPAALIATFNRVDMIEDADTFANLLAWFAVEEVAHWYTNQHDS
jgi:hypothetical protein